MHIVRRLIAVLFVLGVSVPTFAAISGTVMNADGQPVVGAKISVFAPETIDARRARYASATPQRTPLVTASTDSTGSFRVETPKDQPAVELTVTANGYAPARTFALADDEAGALVLTAATSKSGTITANGKPLANATVVWAAGNAEFVAVTDAAGKYTVPDPSKWSDRALVIHPDFARFDEVTTSSILRGRRGNGAGRPGATLEGITADAALAAGVTIKGKVVGADGQTPAGGADLFVDLWPAGKSADDGTFTIAHAPKDWRFVEARSGSNIAVRARSENALTLKLAKGASISGRVIDSKTQAAVAAAPVSLALGGMPGLVTGAIHSTITDAKGNFAFALIPPANYSLQFDRPGYNITPQTVAPTAGQAVNKSVYATPQARVTGTVTDEDHRPVAAARITMRQAAREAFGFQMFNRGSASGVWSGPDGRFVTMLNVPSEAVIIDAAKKGFPSGSSSQMRLSPGEKKAGVMITIPHGIAFTGRVLDKDGKPLSGVAVDATESTREGGMPNIRRMIMSTLGSRGDDVIRTGTDGRFTVRLKEGTYDVNFKREGFAAKLLRAQNVTASVKPVEVTLDPGAEITGRVTRGGAGVEGVNVTAISMDGTASAVTQPDGTYRLTDLTPGQMMLAVAKMDAFIMENRPVTAPAHDVNIDLPAGGRITGHVVDKATHNAVTAFQAGVTTSRSGGGMAIMLPPMLKAFTNDDGSFVLENVRPGPTEVVVNAPGYTSGKLSNVDVEDGKTVADVEVALETGVRVVGRVTDTGGQPIAGVSVRSDASRGGGRMMRFDPTDAAIVTDGNGEYAIESQEPGDKTYTFTRSGYVSDSRTVNLTGKEVRVDVQLSSGMHLSGLVTTDGGTPIGDAVVRAGSASDSTFGREARTDGNGSFTMDGLAPGHYTFNASKSGYANGVVRDVDIATVNPVRITMTTGATITGHVSGFTPDELQGVNVLASASGAGQVTAAVDASGNYRIDGAPTGTVRVVARTTAMLGSIKQTEPKTIVLEAGGSQQVDLEVKSDTVVRGRVTRNGLPLANAGVMFTPNAAKASTIGSTRTDNNGMYELSGLSDGTYNVQFVDYANFSPFGTTHDVHGSGTFDIDIKSITLRGQVLDASTGSPLNGAMIELRGAGDSPMMNSRTAQSDTNGMFTIEYVPSGAFQISADKENYGAESRSLTITDSAPDMQPFKLSPSAGITLSVVDARDGHPLAAAAHAIDMQGHTLDSGMGNPFGGGAPAPITLTAPPGTYTITVSVNGYAPRTLTGVASPSRQTVTMSPGGTLLIRSSANAQLRARLIDANGIPYGRNPFGVSGVFQIPASPGVYTLQNVAAGTYTVQILDNADQVSKSVAVTVIDGQTATADV